MEKELRALIEMYKPDWVVISTLQGLLGERDWKEQKDMSTVNAILVRLQELCPLVLITHSTWDTKNKRAAGTITQAANFLTTMHFEKKIKDGVTTTTVSLDSKMGFEEPEFDLVLETEVVAGKKRPELRRVKYAGEHKPSDAEQIKEYAKEHPDANPKEVSEVVGCSYEYARKVMKKPALSSDRLLRSQRSFRPPPRGWFRRSVARRSSESERTGQKTTGQTGAKDQKHDRNLESGRGEAAG